MMNYGTIYTLYFRSRKEEDNYTVEIQKEGYTGRVAELTGSGDAPFSVEIADDDFLYVPTRFSTATIRVVGNDYLQSLYSTGYQQYRVNFKQGNKIVWTGFVTPELYTQDYTSNKFDLEVQCVSAMNTLEYINYKLKNETDKGFISLWELLTRCVSESRGSYSAIYIPHVYAKNLADYDANTNILQSMTISEQNFFDEDDKPMTLKEVIEELCKFLNWTCVDYKGELYFVDVDHCGDYYKYVPNFSSYTFESGNVVSVQNIGFSGADHTLDILGGYNKAIVKNSNYPVGNLLPEERFEEMQILKVLDNANDKNQVCHRVFLIPNQWETIVFKEGLTIKVDDLQKYKDIAHTFEGAIPMKYCTYKQNKDLNGNWIPEITDYSFTNVIQIRRTKERYEAGPLSTCKVMTTKGASAIYSNGIFCISGSYKFINSDDMIPWDNSSVSDVLYAQIRIGDMYYGSLRPDAGQKNTWAQNPEYAFKLKPERVEAKQDYVSIENQKTLSMPYTGISGVIVSIDRVLQGDFEFTLLMPVGKNFSAGGVLVKDFKIVYQKPDDEKLISNSSIDRYYENVVNEGYINELDEIEFKISSYNNDGACYSKVMLDDNYLTDNLYSSIEQKLVRPEEHLIRRIINQYGATKFKLTQILVDDEAITPITTITDKFQPNKRFTITGGTIDFAMNQFNCKMIENGRY
ncbi:hypothetical protein [Bacteroides fragilis]|uniref:hypothetical protein n=1 Tax=Bacteroides fragilis TaxID=817 RepID=UPI0022AA31BB|nr:hypothetical protein [Bacteroides fragilis]MCS2567244.1 hypothetical protein [Bacteroides fragilis]MCZ2503870.1 hypothetical protein [Bacteroides fragilis]